MGKPILVIGSKSTSSWSLRPWLFLRHHGVPFDEKIVALDRPDTRARILEYSPTGRVPVLHHGLHRVWESLAICEYAAEMFALPQAWPLDPGRRALARALACEMHAGFADLRRELPFAAARKPAKVPMSDKAVADIARICAIWRECRREHGRDGEWLFGRFGIVDAMFAPVALRFHGYAVDVDIAEREYVASVMMHPAVQEWMDDAADDLPLPAAAAERVPERAPERPLAPSVEARPAPAATPAEPAPEEDHESTQPVLRTLMELRNESPALMPGMPPLPAARPVPVAPQAASEVRADAQPDRKTAGPRPESALRPADPSAPKAPASHEAGPDEPKAKDPPQPAPGKIRSVIMPP